MKDSAVRVLRSASKLVDVLHVVLLLLPVCVCPPTLQCEWH